jgi:hypothetical protein
VVTIEHIVALHARNVLVMMYVINKVPTKNPEKPQVALEFDSSEQRI